MDKLEFGTPIALLQTILNNEDLGCYPTVLELGQQIEDDTWSDKNNKSDADILDQTDGFYSLLTKSPFIKKEDISRWHSAIHAHEPSPVYALLLSLLPNLREIILVGYKHDFSFLNAVPLWVNTQKEAGELPTTMLQNLTCAIIEFTRDEDSLDLLAPWAALPSVRGFGFESTYSQHNPSFSQWQNVAISNPNISWMFLVNCEYSKYQLSPVFRNLPALTSFDYGWSEPSEPGNDPFNLQSLADTLMEFYGDTLLKLRLWGRYERPTKPLRCLHGLRKLRDLDIQPEMLHDPETGEVGKLVEILPPSTETIWAFLQGYHRTSRGSNIGKQEFDLAVFADFEQKRRSLLPMLHHLVLETLGYRYNGDWKDLDPLKELMKETAKDIKVIALGGGGPFEC
ncbi:hypothetical protein MMC17_001627 [Xylographa soralifera]|nr:hypothetical protein [Xylographa soralifera]